MVFKKVLLIEKNIKLLNNIVANKLFKSNNLLSTIIL